jgi:hypothetical protein
MLEDTRAKTIQRGHMESHPYFTNVDIWRERNQRLFEDRESNVHFVLQLKSSFLSSLLDWAVSSVPNFSSSSLVDLENFLDFRSQ